MNLKPIDKNGKVINIDLTKSKKIIIASCEQLMLSIARKELVEICNEHICEWMELQKNGPKEKVNEQEKEEEKALTIPLCIVSEDLKSKKDEIRKSEYNDLTQFLMEENEKLNENRNEIYTFLNLPPVKKRKLNNAKPVANAFEAKPELGEKSMVIIDEISNKLKNEPSVKYCQWICCGHHSIVIEILPSTSITAVELLHFMFEKTFPKRPRFPLSILKFYPLDRTCVFNDQQIILLAKKMIDEFWTSDILPTKDAFAILIRRRRRIKINRDLLTSEIAAHSKLQGFKVNLNLKAVDEDGGYAGPSVVIMIQTFGGVAGVSIIKDNMFHRYKQYNVEI